jgi:hypothetical protein
MRMVYALFPLGVAKSQQKTTVAVLRQIIGFDAESFARFIGRSVSTVKSVESGRLALSRELAKSISRRTGIAIAWLCAGDPTAEPYSNSTNAIPETESSGEADSAEAAPATQKRGPVSTPYTRETFKRYVVRTKKAEYLSVSYEDALLNERTTGDLSERVSLLSQTTMTILEGARRHGDLDLALYDLEEFHRKMLQRYASETGQP